MKRRLWAACLCGIAALAAAASVFVSDGTAASAAAPPVSARSMITIENSSDRVLYERNADEKLSMASTTKIVTAITVIDTCPDLEKVVTVPDAAVGVEGSSVYLERGEKLKIIDLLYGLMLQSGNDCAAALAISTAGSLEKFADRMNATAEKAGAKNSHFVTPHGLHDDAHYTTARDLALITSYAMKNPVFAQIVSTRRYTMPWQGRNYDRVILNKNKLLASFDGCDGVKTGFTKQAGRCLVSSATRNGMRVISVVLNDGPMFEDCAALMERAFDEYELVQLVPENDVCCRVPVSEGKAAEVGVAPTDRFSYPLRADERDKVRVAFEPAESLAAPVQKGAEAGNFSVTLDNRLLFTGKLYTINSVGGYDFTDYARKLVENW